jgi:tetratricopeptide (TPR) repeat protein
MGVVIHVDFGKVTSRQLFAQAEQLDENPITWEEAKQLYNRALALDPTFAEAWVNLGNILFKQRSINVARKCYETAVKHDSGSVEGNYNLGYIHLSEGRHALASEYYLKSLKTDETYADAHYNLALAFERLADDNIEDCMGPDGYGTARYMGKYYTRLARKHYQRYIELDPDSSWSKSARLALERLG